MSTGGIIAFGSGFNPEHLNKLIELNSHDRGNFRHQDGTKQLDDGHSDNNETMTNDWLTKYRPIPESYYYSPYGYAPEEIMVEPCVFGKTLKDLGLEVDNSAEVEETVKTAEPQKEKASVSVKKIFGLVLYLLVGFFIVLFLLLPSPLSEDDGAQVDYAQKFVDSLIAVKGYGVIGKIRLSKVDSKTAVEFKAVQSYRIVTDKAVTMMDMYGKSYLLSGISEKEFRVNNDYNFEVKATKANTRVWLLAKVNTQKEFFHIFNKLAADINLFIANLFGSTWLVAKIIISLLLAGVLGAWTWIMFRKEKEA